MRTATTKPHAKKQSAARAKSQRGFDTEWADRLCHRLLMSAFPGKQRDAVEDPGNFVTFLCARGAGKTTAEILRMLRKMIRVPKARCVYIATTRDAARLLVWDELKDVVEKLGIGPETGESSFAESRLTFTLTRNGSTLRLVGADDEREIDKLRGKSYHEVGIDEAASHPQKLLERLIERVISPRLGDTDGCIVLFGTPGHHLQGLFYEATRPGGSVIDKATGQPVRPLHRPYADRDNPEVKPAMWSSHAWNLLDGAEHVPALMKLWKRALEDKAKAGWSDKHPVWCRERLGLWSADDTENMYKYHPHLPADDERGPEGSPWNEWNPERIGPLRLAKLPEAFKDWLYAFGADMGSADPFALNVLAGSPTDPTRTLYHVFEFESQPDAKMYGKRIAELLFGPDTRKDGDSILSWPNHLKPQGVIGAVGWPAGAMADMSHLGESILEEVANVYGFRFEAGPRGDGDKISSIELFNGDLVDGRIKVLKGSKLATQLGTLQWAVDEFGKVKIKKGDSNHSSDAALMARNKLTPVLMSYGAPPPAPTTPIVAGRIARSAPDVDGARTSAAASSFAFDDDAGDSLGSGFDDGWGNDAM